MRRHRRGACLPTASALRTRSTRASSAVWTTRRTCGVEAGWPPAGVHGRRRRTLRRPDRATGGPHPPGVGSRRASSHHANLQERASRLHPSPSTSTWPPAPPAPQRWSRAGLARLGLVTRSGIPGAPGHCAPRQPARATSIIGDDEAAVASCSEALTEDGEQQEVPFNDVSLWSCTLEGSGASLIS